jgi:deazaflavin-dependent oxidoreductase (nitroreductase family)
MAQTKYIRWVPKPDTIKRIGKLHVRLYRATFGLVGKRVDGLDILLLTTRGRKTGLLRTVPLPYFRDGERYLLVGSFGGNAKNPAWIGNLEAHPDAQIQVGHRKLAVRASLAQGEERARLWDQITRDFPRYKAYQEKTDRLIPVVVLTPLTN